MSGRDRVAALQRARQRQQRIEEATTRATKAQARVERMLMARQAAVAKADARVTEARQQAACEVANLATIAGSTTIAAEILGLSQREAQRAVAAARQQHRAAESR